MSEKNISGTADEKKKEEMKFEVLTLFQVKEKILSTDFEAFPEVSDLEKVRKTAKQLRLRVKNSPLLAKDFVVSISCEGYLSPLVPGVVYFGGKRKIESKGAKLNDFVVPSEQLSPRGRFFLIYYSIVSDSYFIRDLGTGPGVYIKLEYSYKLTSDILLNIGETQLYFRLVLSENSYPNLLLTVFGNTVKNYFFYAQEQHISPIKIGRADDCDILIEDMLISKYQACILYSHSKGWMFIDGNLIKQRPSTNGAW